MISTRTKKSSNTLKLKEETVLDEDVISWDQYFMGVALLSAKRSKDPSTKVGACIVGRDKRILSMGYNGTPNGVNDDKFIWNREGNYLDTKYPYVIHAEANAILNFKGDTRSLEGSTIYVTLFPCNECAKFIAQSGIKNVIYLSDKYSNTDTVIAAKRILDMCNINYTSYTESVKEMKSILQLCYIG